MWATDPRFPTNLAELSHLKLGAAKEKMVTAATPYCYGCVL